MRALISQTLVEAGRLVRRWPRQQDVLTATLIFPVLLLLMYQLVLDRALTAASGTAAVYGFVPMIAVTGAMYGAMGTGMSLHAEAESGLLRRFWVLPIHRAAGLAGRLLAECARTLVATAIVLLLGVALGLRFQHGWWGPLGLLLVPVLLMPGFVALVVAVAVGRAGAQIVQLFSVLILLGMFFNSGFVPVTDYPGWLQPVVRAQPMSCAIEAMRDFILGGPLLVPVSQTAAWSAGLALVFGGFAVRGYRRAAAG
ncbi:ABC transporter permease [Nocardia aurantia]|uniref:Transport permease protein n=1 Tax=Nocardia aurantia TaxID=2585199 RepID=A0A7K0DHA4_9NOCA|nr:ABC transporter permease [Nocardia aurantia]MQY24931.1 putative doxorubicin resistance ABC transporter permease protein DrrC [Nocardia aurantia]